MLYQTGIQQKHQLSVSGGSERVQYSIAANVFTQEGVLPSRKFERYTIRPNIDIELTRNLKIGLSTLLSYNKKHSDMEVSMALEDAFKIEIPDDQQEKLRTVQQAIDYIKANAK